MAEKMLSRLINRNENIEYLGIVLAKTEKQLLNEVSFSLKEVLDYVEEPLDIIHSERRIKHNGKDYNLSCIDINNDGNVVVALTDSSFQNEFEIPIKELSAHNLIELYNAVSFVLERILDKQINDR